jgi:aspartate-semialdehyde dehydrogenase
VAERIDVGLIGATGTVGVRLAELLSGHPWFRLAEVGASASSAGRAYGAALADLAEPSRGSLSKDLLDLHLKTADEPWASPLLLSALPGNAALAAEEELAGRGHVIVSNASSYRMDPAVPLIIPEVNADHLGLLDAQAERWPGAIVTNPNCAVVGLALALAPLHQVFGVGAVTVTTLQGVSGAGRPGPAAADLLGNVLPFIAGEEEKLASEPQKILGEYANGKVHPAEFPVSAHTHRVPVAHGHLLAVSVKLKRPAGPEEVEAALSSFEGGIVDLDLPTAPERVLRVLADDERPQPTLDRDRGAGMTVSVGRVRQCETLDVKFSALVHNLIRGAAGAALLNAELCLVRGVVGGGDRG